MTRLFRSKSCGLVGLTEVRPVTPPNPFFQRSVEEDEDEEFCDEEQQEEEEYYIDASRNPMNTPFISPASRFNGADGGDRGGRNGNSHNQYAILDVLVTALRKSIVTCSVEKDDVSSMDISWPTEVRHESHVTFDRFNGFLGLPTELEPHVPRKVPSASAKVFGVSANSMQCWYDERGNSVPIILLMMQKRLYVEGGLKAEGIFRINAENSQEEYVRDQLNKGVVPCGIDLHCLAGLIKAWFRELPSGVLDSLTPEQVMHCNTEDDCTQLVKLLPPTEAALLDWAINLMADVVEHEQYNKMNARNIAMVFAPNMTQMADPLTALIHAVQVMNLLKTLILRTLRQRGESVALVRLRSASSNSPDNDSETCQAQLMAKESSENVPTSGTPQRPIAPGRFLRSATISRTESNAKEKYWDFPKKDGENEFESTSGSSSASLSNMVALENRCKDGYDSGDWFSLRKGVRRLCRHPVFQLSKPTKKTPSLGIVSNREGDGEAWA
ncbi:hypothetical protein K2173_025311 [Erythroxylum novogranatense]|uniref:Rho-GAP domain-containing protein n=1 Tax=Erythroxylum novogranatense TaxID=1862640 RepID=A0AAV8UES8_9ROSI|nr:hypothetical protein K2173_025311 [Erythroxylum novogranatense]